MKQMVVINLHNPKLVIVSIMEVDVVVHSPVVQRGLGISCIAELMEVGDVVLIPIVRNLQWEGTMFVRHMVEVDVVKKKGVRIVLYLALVFVLDMEVVVNVRWMVVKRLLEEKKIIVWHIQNCNNKIICQQSLAY